MADKTLQLGSISHGTMRDEDLIPAFMDALESVNAGRAKDLRKEYSKVFTVLDADAWDKLDSAIPSHAKLLEDASYLVNEDLFDALNEHVPDYCYFGAHEGDGSDYGVWVSEDAIRDGIHDKDIIPVEDLSELDGKLVLLTNDHGNQTLYRLTVGEEVWSIV